MNQWLLINGENWASLFLKLNVSKNQANHYRLLIVLKTNQNHNYLITTFSNVFYWETLNRQMHKFLSLLWKNSIANFCLTHSNFVLSDARLWQKTIEEKTLGEVRNDICPTLGNWKSWSKSWYVKTLPFFSFISQHCQKFV